MAQRKKNKTIVKNTMSLRYELEKKKEQVENKHKYIKEKKPKLFESINNIINSFDNEYNYINMSGKNTTYYVASKSEFEKSPVEPLNNVKQTYKELNKKLYQKIIAQPKQTGLELQNKNINRLQKLNFSESKSYNNFTYQSVKEAMDNIQKTGKAIVYDLETYGGTNAEGVWSPRGITEYSFQTVNVEKYKNAIRNNPDANILDYIDKETAVVGWTKEERDKWVSKISNELAKNGGEIKDEELRVTALRLQLYGNAEKVTDANGITKVTKFVGNEAYIGGLDEATIKKGADFLHQAYLDAEKHKTANGLLPYHEKFFKSIADIKNSGHTLLDFNGINFDMKILNSQLSDLYYNTYGENEQAKRAIATMFGFDKNKPLSEFKGPGIHLPSNKRVDISGVFKTAADVAGLKSVYGNHYEEVLGDFNKTRLNRQEIYGEAMLKGIDEVMDKSTRHLAEQDTTVAALMSIMENKNFKRIGEVGPNGPRFRHQSALENALETIQNAVEEGKIHTTTIEQKDFGKKIFMSKGSMTTPGRSMLNFTVDQDGTIKTASNYLIGEGNEHLKALGGIEKAGYNISANPIKGLLYTVDDMFEVDMDSDLVKEMTNSMPEFASNKVVAVKMNTYLPGNLKEKYGQFNNSHYLFFTDTAEAEKYLSDTFDYIGNKKTETSYLKDFDVNNVVRDRVKIGTEEAERVKYRKINKRKEWDLAKKQIDDLIANGADIKPLGEFQTKTATRTITKKKPNGEKYKEKIEYQISNGKNYAPMLNEDGSLVYEKYNKPVYANGVVIGKDGKPINEKDLYTKVEHEGIEFVNKNAEDAITYVDANKKLTKVKDTINADGTTEKIKVAIDDKFDTVYNYLDEALANKAEERANNAFNRDTYKSSRNFNSLLKQMFPDSKEEINPVEVKQKLQQAKNIANEISKNVANGKPLTAKTLKEKLGYDLIGTLGFKSHATGNGHLISSTLNNFIESTEKYVDLNDVFKGIRGAVDVKHKDKAATIKFNSMLDYMVDKFITDKKESLPENLLKKTARITKKDMKNIFEVNVESFIDPKNVENLQHSLSNTIADKNIARINLKSGPGTLAKNVSKMLYQNRGNTVDANAHEAFAMRKFVEHMHQQNPEMFEQVPTLKNLIESIKEEKAMAKFDNKFKLSNTEAAGKFIADELIRGLKEYKEEAGYDKGIIRQTFNNADILNDKKIRKSFVNYVKSKKDLVEEAYENTGSIVRYSFEGLNDFKPGQGKSAMKHISDIVDDIFMPTVNGLKGDKALKYIQGHSNYNKVQQEYVETLWKKTREAHVETVTQIAQLVQNTGGILMTAGEELIAVHNDQAIAFKGLAKTRYDYGNIYHNIDSTNIVAKLQLGVDKNNRNILESNLVNVNSTLRRNKRIIEEAKKKGEWRPELIDNFKSKVTNKMREESVISTFNAHERKRQFEIDFATESFGKRLSNLVGVNKTQAVWGDKQTLTKGTIDLIREEIERLGTRFDPENLSPQIIEALGKEMPYLLNQDVNTSEELKKYLPYISASAKDKDMSKHITYVVDEDRYHQAALNSFDNPQRPTLQAGKVDYSVERTEAGLERYNEMVKYKKQVLNGSLLDTHDSNRKVTGKAVGEIDSAITVKKANAGNLAVRSIIENEYKKVMDNNDISKAVKKEQAKIFALLEGVTNLQEQEKIMDSRLMDAVFNQSANTQYISHKDITTYYADILNTDEWAKKPKNKIEKAERKEARRIINTIEGNRLKIAKDEAGNLVVKTPSGSMVRRGDSIMKYYDRYNSGIINSKIDIGRFQHGVFEKAGNIKLSDDQIKAYLESHLDIEKLNGKELQDRAYELLDQEFNFKFFVSDIEQQSYGKYMDGAVEKDMTNGLYVKLGQLDKSVRERVSKTKYKGISGKELLDKVIKIDEIEEIFKSDQQLIKDIKKERHALSKKMFDEFKPFRDVSLIVNHQTDKHKNYGLITEGVIGNIYDKLLTSEKAKSKEDATKILMDKLSEYDVFDKTNTKLEVKDGAIFIKPVDDKAAKKVVNKYKMHGEENLLENVKSLNLNNLEKMMSEDELIGSLGLYHKEVTIFDSKSKKNITMKNVYGDLSKIKSVDNKDIVISKSFATLQQAVDPETMTVYDYQTVKALGIKRKAEREAIEANIYANKKLEKIAAQGTEITKEIRDKVRQEKGFKKHYDKARELYAEADFILGDMENISKVKTIGRQEMRIYNNKVFNFATENVANNYLKEAKAKGEEEFTKAKEYIDKFYAGILKNNGQDHYELVDEFRGKGVYENITKDIIKQKIFKEGDIELNDEVLTYGGKGYLKDVYNRTKKVITQEFQDENAKVSLRYAEELYQADSAHVAHKFNNASGHINLDVMKDKGFKIVGLGDQSHLKEGMKPLSTVGEISAYGMDSIFTSNTLLYLGEEIAEAGPDNPAGYLAIPKAGKVLENNTISEMFQNKLKVLNEKVAEYQTGSFTHGSNEQKEKLQNLKDMVDNIKDLIRVHTYEKSGAIHDLGKYEMDEAFRLKFSFVNNSHMVEGIGDQNIMAEIINKGDSALKVAKINGKSIYDLEKQGAFLDYAFVGSNVFEKLGYFEDEKLQSLGKYDKKTGALEYINHEGKKRSLNLNISKDKDIAIEDMKQHLRENGIVANTGRYPMIMDDSDKATRIFLNDDITTKNRARASVATALSMNADNDGDSASFGVFKLASGKTYNDYQMAKVQAQRELKDASYDEIKAHIMKNSNMSEYDYKAFRSLDVEMANAAIGKNRFYNEKSLDDVRGELLTSVKNGTLNETMDSLTHKNLYQGMMYANAGSTVNMNALQKNANRIDSFIERAGEIDKDVLKMRRIDIGEHSALAGGEDMASYFDKILSTVGNYNEKDGKFILNQKAKEIGITNEEVENFRQHAVARTRWFDSLKEAQSKSRKGSIGPVNVGMQGIRAAGEVLYQDADNIAQVQKKNIANWMAYELEEEVIGAKHGSVVNNITKAKDLNSLVNKVVHGDKTNVGTREEHMQEFKTWLNGGLKADKTEIDANLSDKAVNNIWKRLETSGIVTEKDLPKLPAGNMTEDEIRNTRRRSYVVQSIEEVLNDIANNEDAKRAMKANKVGGSGADHTYIMGRGERFTLDSINHSILDIEGFEESLTKKANAELADSIPIAHGSTGSSGALMEAGAKASDKILKLSGGKGLALTALGIAGMTLAAGYAGGPLAGGGASAREQEENAKHNNTVPSMMDQSDAVVRNSNRGYIINIKANSNHDMKQTKRAMRQAAQAASGGVNVNMTVKNKDTMISNNDIEQFLTGL